MAEQFGIPFRDSYERKLFYDMLDNINKDEHDEGRPLLSVLVVNESLMPGDGFFKLAKRLKKQEPDEGDVEFYCNERSKVIDYWKSHPDPNVGTP